MQIECAHRVNNKRNREKMTKPRTFVSNIVSYKQKEEVLETR